MNLLVGKRSWMLAPAVFLLAAVLLFLTWAVMDPQALRAAFDADGHSFFEVLTLPFYALIVPTVWLCCPFAGSTKRKALLCAAVSCVAVMAVVKQLDLHIAAMTSLYPLGFRESQQSRDDVRAAVVADEVLGKLTAALSSRNITWEDWNSKIEHAVDVSNQGGAGSGWFSYYTKRGSDTYVVMNSHDTNKHAKDVFDALMSVCDGATGTERWVPDDDYAQGLVVQWGKRIVAAGNGTSEACDDPSRVSISFRLARRSGALMTAPVYYTEVHFQGDQRDMKQ